MSVKETVTSLVEKATIANLAAGTVVVGGGYYAVVNGKWEIVAGLIGFAAGYLWPKKQ